MIRLITRHEFHGEPEAVSGSLLSFVYDVPYLSACGVFRPLHHFNARLASSGGDGGMSPGASWQPFQVDADTYQALMLQIQTVDPKTLRDQSRYQLRFIEAPEFAHIEDWETWLITCCDHYREWFHQQFSK